MQGALLSIARGVNCAEEVMLFPSICERVRLLNLPSSLDLLRYVEVERG